MATAGKAMYYIGGLQENKYKENDHYEEDEEVGQGKGLCAMYYPLKQFHSVYQGLDEPQSYPVTGLWKGEYYYPVEILRIR